MIKLTDFLAFPEPAKAKIKFNMNAGDITKPAWDLLLNGCKLIPETTFKRGYNE